ncbi:UNVERIFIED_CONTAM: hypothetical protein FKN15_076531 [Acipenser sinensis]
MSSRQTPEIFKADGCPNLEQLPFCIHNPFVQNLAVRDVSTHHAVADSTSQVPDTDDIYAYGLSVALTKVVPPSTVGLYSSCPSRIKRLLSKIETGDSSGDGITVIESMAIATLGLPAAGAVRFTILLSKNLMFNQDFKIQRQMDAPKMSAQLGFMNEVRKEVEILINFIRFMEVLERRNIRVVLEITNLDRCTPEKIAGVLDAINILLSGENIPFISILAIDPRVIVKSVESFESVDKNGYKFLNRIVTLPFTVPEMDISSKRRVFRKLVERQSEFPEDGQLEESQGISYEAERSKVLEESCMESGIAHESQIPLISCSPDRRERNIGIQKIVKDLIKETLRVISEEGDEGNFKYYLMENSIHMRRIINSVRVSIIVMASQREELPPAREIAAWIVLANQWPCRLSWILQCIEDDEQRAEIDKDFTGEDSIDETKLLWDVFCESRLEFHLIKDHIKNFLEIDGDPELFEMFLKKDFLLTIQQANCFKAFTVNLDPSIKKELELIRGSKNLKDTIKLEKAMPLKSGFVLKMNEDDVCKEMEKLKFSERNTEKYMQRIKENNLDGRALLFGHYHEIKNVLQMSMGEWTAFSIHFLGIKPQAVSPYVTGGLVTCVGRR